jgi:hypothetical protein
VNKPGGDQIDSVRQRPASAKPHGQRRDQMKTLLAATAIAFVAFVNLSPASAAQYGQPETGNWHYAWQYHYVGHHPHYQGGWVLTK